MMLEVLDASGARFAQEAERRRIARELHDSVVQSLTALVVDLEFFRTWHLSGDGDEMQAVAAKLESWQALARGSLISMRETLGGLRQQTDQDFSLEASVETLLAELRSTGYVVTYEYTDWPLTLPFEYNSNLYYIIREALTNVCKHARASHINVFLFSHEGRLHISVGDNGIGIITTPPVASRQDGYQQGLVGMRERVMHLGGRLSIESIPGKGTRVDVSVPQP